MSITRPKPRQALIEMPFPGENTACRCGAPLVRHIIPLGRLGGAATVDEEFDTELGKWVETRLVFDTSQYVYSCSVCHVAHDLCDCDREDITRSEPWEEAIE